MTIRWNCDPFLTRTHTQCDVTAPGRGHELKNPTNKVIGLIGSCDGWWFLKDVTISRRAFFALMRSVISFFLRWNLIMPADDRFDAGFAWTFIVREFVSETVGAFRNFCSVLHTLIRRWEIDVWWFCFDARKVKKWLFFKVGYGKRYESHLSKYRTSGFFDGFDLIDVLLKNVKSFVINVKC